MSFPLSRRAILVRVLLFGLVIVSSAVGGCSPSKGPNTSGELTLRYIDRSDTHFEFLLTNGTTQPIKVVGEEKMSGAVIPSSSASGLDCRSTDSSDRTSGGFGLEEGAQNTSIQISSGQARRILVATTYFTPFTGQQCQLKLKIGVDRILDSTDFVP